MKLFRRFALAFATVATLGTVSVLALSTTSAGSSLLRSAGRHLVVTADAGGGGLGGTMTITITGATLTGRVDATAHIDYVCDQMYDAFGFPVPASQTSGYMNVSIQQRVGNGVANGYGSANIQPACDRTFYFSGTTNHVDVLVMAFGSPFKKGTAVAQANGQACGTGGFTSFGPPPCDSGQSDPTVLTISK